MGLRFMGHIREKILHEVNLYNFVVDRIKCSKANILCDAYKYFLTMICSGLSKATSRNK